MEDMFSALREEDSARMAGGSPDTDASERAKNAACRKFGSDHRHHYYCDSRLACAVRRFYIGLVCHDVGGVPFRSPVISFCAMLSRKKPRKGSGDEQTRKSGNSQKSTRPSADEELDTDDVWASRQKRKLGTWVKPRHYTSHLSKLVWVAQLMIFETACFYKKGEEDQVPAVLERICRRFMHQKGETAYGHILQWRLYLGTVAESAISSTQARWSLDGEEMVLLGKRFSMNHVPQLVVSEYKMARTILFDKLLFGAKDIPSVEAWMLHDDLDAEEYGGSWLTNERN
ncbi:MAG: hypothetical protein ACREQ3_25255 [Candidatus Binatia bacterium]